MKIIPPANKVYIQLDNMLAGKVIKDETGKEYTIHFSDKHSEPSRKATVKAIGPDVTQYKVGDRVFVNFYTGILIRHYDFEDSMDNLVYKICTEDEILTPFEED